MLGDLNFNYDTNIQIKNLKTKQVKNKITVNYSLTNLDCKK